MKRVTLFLSVVVSLLTGFERLSAQDVAKAVAFTAATSNSATEAFKVPHGAFIPFFPKTEEPTIFDISEEHKRFVSIIVLPKGSAFGGVQFNTPGVLGYNFPDAKGNITIVIANNSSGLTQRVVIATWKNPSTKEIPLAAPLKSGIIYIDVAPDPASIKGKPGPIVVPDEDDTKPVPKPDNLVYKGKALLCIFEKSEAATAQRGAFFSSKELRAYLADKLIKHPDVIDATDVPPSLQPYYQLFLDSKSSLPYFFYVAAQDEGNIKKGTILKQGPITAGMTPAEFMNQLK